MVFAVVQTNSQRSQWSVGSRGGGRRAFSSARRRSSMALASASSAVSPGSSRATRPSTISAARFRSLRSRRAVSRRPTGSALRQTHWRHVCCRSPSLSYAGPGASVLTRLEPADVMRQQADATLMRAGYPNNPIHCTPHDGSERRRRQPHAWVSCHAARDAHRSCSGLYGCLMMAWLPTPSAPPSRPVSSCRAIV